MGNWRTECLRYVTVWRYDLISIIIRWIGGTWDSGGGGISILGGKMTAVRVGWNNGWDELEGSGRDGWKILSPHASSGTGNWEWIGIGWLLIFPFSFDLL